MISGTEINFKQKVEIIVLLVLSEKGIWKAFKIHFVAISSIYFSTFGKHHVWLQAVSIMPVSRYHILGYSITGYLRYFITFCATTTKNKLLNLGILSRKGNSEDTLMTVTNTATKAGFQ